MTTERLIYYALIGMEGQSVADQFKDVFENGEPLEDQNLNALDYIAYRLKELKECPALESVSNEIDEYIDQIDEFLTFK